MDSAGGLSDALSPSEADGGGQTDPLASRTLAALLAFQGQATAAAGVFRQLGGTEPALPEALLQEDRRLAALLAFREAARRLRSMHRIDE